jgi:hypothetical protein
MQCERQSFQVDLACMRVLPTDRSCCMFAGASQADIELFVKSMCLVYSTRVYLRGLEPAIMAPFVALTDAAGWEAATMRIISCVQDQLHGIVDPTAKQRCQRVLSQLHETKSADSAFLLQFKNERMPMPSQPAQARASIEQCAQAAGAPGYRLGGALCIYIAGAYSFIPELAS